MKTPSEKQRFSSISPIDQMLERGPMTTHSPMVLQVIADILSSATSARWDAFVTAAIGNGEGECPANILLEKLVAGWSINR